MRFDNRDVGLSTHYDGSDRDDPPYSLWDIADDAVAVLDALGIARAHVLGASMGGVIAQMLAVRHQERLLSLACLMSSTGASNVPPPTKDAWRAIRTPVPSERAGYIDAAVDRARTLRGGGFPFDEARVRLRAAGAYDRSFDPAARARQRAAAVAGAEDLSERLRAVSLPTVAIHGTDDPLVDVQGGRSIASAVTGAELVLIPGLGHELPVEVWGRVAEAVAWNASRHIGDQSGRGDEPVGRASTSTINRENP